MVKSRFCLALESLAVRQPTVWAGYTPRAGLLRVHSARFPASVVAHLFSCTHTDVITSILVALDTFISLFLISFAESYFKEPAPGGVSLLEEARGVSLIEEASSGFLTQIAVSVLLVLPLPGL